MTVLPIFLAIFLVGATTVSTVLFVQMAKNIRSTYRTMAGTALVLARNWERLGRHDEAEEERRDARKFARLGIGWQPRRKAKVEQLLAEAARQS